MRIAVCMLTNKTNRFKNFINLFVDVRLIGNTVNNKSLSDNITNCHTGIKRSNRILEDHLYLCNKSASLRYADSVSEFLTKSLKHFFIAGSLAEFFSVFFLESLDERFCILLIYYLTVRFCITDKSSVLVNDCAELLVDLFNLCLDLSLSCLARVSFSAKCLYLLGSILAGI